MFVERKVCKSALFTNLAGLHASAVSFPLSDVNLAQLADETRYHPYFNLLFLRQTVFFNSSLLKPMLSNFFNLPLCWEKSASVCSKQLGPVLQNINISNLQQIDRFLSKLVSFVLSVANTLAWGNTLAN